MKRSCDDTSPFVLACHSGRIRGAFSGGDAEGPSTSVVQGHRVVLANELNPVLNSVSLSPWVRLCDYLTASSMFSPSNTLLICKFRYCKCVMTVEPTQP